MSIQHFLYSLLGILNEMSPYILLGFFIAGLLHEFVKPEMMSRHLSGKGLKPVIKAALFGIPLPLCSCGVLPTAVGLHRQGASKGATTSFLIATPQTGVDSIVATYSLLGLPFAIIRPIAALIGAVLGGGCVAKAEKGVNGCIKGCNTTLAVAAKKGFFVKLWGAVRYGFIDMVASVGKWLVIGLVVAALITVFVPDELFLSLSKYPLLAMIVMVAVAIPMYICATGSIPIAMSLMLKGLTPGVAFVLLMAGPAANFASIMVLGKELGRRTTAVYVGSVVVTAIAIGLVIDYFLPSRWFALSATAGSLCCAPHHIGWFAMGCSVFLLAALVNAFVYTHKHANTQLITNNMTKEYRIKGMMCNHCRLSVEKAISEVEGAVSVTVDLRSGKAVVEGEADPKAVIEAVEKAGYHVENE